MTKDGGEAFQRFSRAVDGPLLVLALAMIPLIVVPIVVDLSPGLDRALLAVDYLIWAVFAIEYVVKLYLTPNRWRFVKANIPDLVIVIVPMLRLLRLARLVAFAVEGMQEAREVGGRAGRPKGKHNPERTAVRHGHERGSVTPGCRRVPVQRLPAPPSTVGVSTASVCSTAIVAL